MNRNDYPTVPNKALQSAKPRQVAQVARPLPRQSVPVAPQPRPKGAQHRPAKRSLLRRFWWLIPVTLIGLFVVTLASAAIGLHLLYADRILPGVRVGTVALSGLSQEEAAQTLERTWQEIILRDGERTWRTNAAEIGLTLDASQTAAAAFAQGHGEGGLTAMFNTVQVAPIVNVNQDALTRHLFALAPNFEIAPINAGVVFEEGAVRSTPPQNGRILDVAAIIASVQADASAELADGALDLVMGDVAPEVTDATPLVAEARALLSNPLDIQVYDPVTGDSVYWSAPPVRWGNWLTATPDASSSIGLAFDADPNDVRAFLQEQASANFDSSRTLDFDAAVETVRAAINAGQPQNAYVIVQHSERTHTVRPGETITSIAWDYGIPYPYIQQANNGIDALSVGQQLVIPPADKFLLRDVVPNKRIVVDLSDQRTRVYENGELKWDWLSSTGIDSSPTWTGVYQVISHEPNAYAGNWNLYMPNFIGVYQPIPGSEFTNGFHGFPTRGGGQLLWQNDLGRRVTYGCILLSDSNVQILYNWAEEGVVVEIRA